MSEIRVAPESTVAEAESEISSCEKCNPAADIQFGMILNFVRDASPEDVVFYQIKPAKCPLCNGEVWESTMVRLFPRDMENWSN